ncbi:hypothetical protein FQN60_000669 [Etheostoma spectabile]|uniref:Uncharacterized protein n=1 Tax=Etheostoma spectabile TaxID=54343 RepID=A0A5J5D102_9PERO|nr:hypothetical protein FQN60_000669 [Etheostoma spectabile]
MDPTTPKSNPFSSSQLDQGGGDDHNRLRRGGNEGEGNQGGRWSEHDIGFTGDETEWDVRPGKVAGAWQQRSQHHRPPAQRDIQQSPTSRGLPEGCSSPLLRLPRYPSDSLLQGGGGSRVAVPQQAWGDPRAAVSWSPPGGDDYGGRLLHQASGLHPEPPGHLHLLPPSLPGNREPGTHSLCREHFINGVVVLLSQDGQLPGLLLLQPLEHGLVISLWRGLQQMVPEGLLVGELCLVLGPDQLCPRPLDRPQMPELQLLHRLVMSEQHGMLQVLLCLPFVQLLKKMRGAGVTKYLSSKILLHIVSGDEDPTLYSRFCDSRKLLSSFFCCTWMCCWNFFSSLGRLVFFEQLLHFLGEVVPLALQLFVQPQPVLIHLPFQLVLQGHQMLLMLPPHAFVSRHLLPQLRVLLVFLHLTGHLQDVDTGENQHMLPRGLSWCWLGLRGFIAGCLLPRETLLFFLETCMTELLDMTVWSPSISSSSLRLSWAASFRLLTELLWELALMDMLGMD